MPNRVYWHYKTNIVRLEWMLLFCVFYEPRFSCSVFAFFQASRLSDNCLRKFLDWIIIWASSIELSCIYIVFMTVYDSTWLMKWYWFQNSPHNRARGKFMTTYANRVSIFILFYLRFIFFLCVCCIFEASDLETRHCKPFASCIIAFIGIIKKGALKSSI